MAAAFREHLVFQNNPGGTGTLELLDRTHNVMQITMPGIGIGNHRYRDAVRHAPRRVDHFAHAQKIQIRQTV